jgi:hypothetical protein
MAGLIGMAAMGSWNNILSNDLNSYDISKCLMNLTVEDSKYIYSYDSEKDCDEFFIIVSLV